MQIAWTPYTTPTPLPDRPNWNSTDWFNYFKGNHPNFWFKEKLKKEALAKIEKEKLEDYLSNTEASNGAEMKEYDQEIQDFQDVVNSVAKVVMDNDMVRLT